MTKKKTKIIKHKHKAAKVTDANKEYVDDINKELQRNKKGVNWLSKGATETGSLPGWSILTLSEVLREQNKNFSLKKYTYLNKLVNNIWDGDITLAELWESINKKDLKGLTTEELFNKAETGAKEAYVKGVEYLPFDNDPKFRILTSVKNYEYLRTVLKNANDDLELNEMFDTQNLQPNTFVDTKSHGKVYVDDVDFSGSNPDNPFKHLAAFVKKTPASKDGTWVSWSDLKKQYPIMNEKKMYTMQELRILGEDSVLHDANKFYFKNKKQIDRNILKVEPQMPSEEEFHSPQNWKPEHWSWWLSDQELDKDSSIDTSQHNLRKHSSELEQYSSRDNVTEDQEKRKFYCPGCRKDYSIYAKKDDPGCPKCGSKMRSSEHAETNDFKKLANKQGWKMSSLKESKINGVLAKWQKRAQDIAKELYPDKKWNKLSEKEQSRSYDESEKRKTNLSLTKIVQIGREDFEDEEEN